MMIASQGLISIIVFKTMVVHCPPLNRDDEALLSANATCYCTSDNARTNYDSCSMLRILTATLNSSLHT